MPNADPVKFELPADFVARCQRTNQRVLSGEAMSMQHIADALGLPFEFVSAAMAITAVLQSGRSVLVDPAPATKAH